MSVCLHLMTYNCIVIFASVCCISENDVVGETVDCGLTEATVGYLFDGSFKKQIKFQQFVRQHKEGEIIVTLELSCVDGNVLHLIYRKFRTIPTL